MTSRFAREIDSGTHRNVAPPHESSGKRDGVPGGGRFLTRIRRSDHSIRIMLLMCLAALQSHAMAGNAQPALISGESRTLPWNGGPTMIGVTSEFVPPMIRMGVSDAQPMAAVEVRTVDPPRDTMARWFGIFGFALLLTRSARRA